MNLLYRLIQWTWGIPQNIIGLLIFLCCTDRKYQSYHGALVSNWNREAMCAGCGMFIFMGKSTSFDTKKAISEQKSVQRLLIHEYGHTIQSLILGPLFLFVITIPSALWALLPFFKNRRMQRGTSYYSAFTERWADALGSYIFYHK